MANSYSSGGMWVIDTAGYVSPTDPSRGTRECPYIGFSGITLKDYTGGVADTLTINEDGASGKEIIKLIGSADNSPVGYVRGAGSRPIRDLYITALPTGAKVIFDVE